MKEVFVLVLDDEENILNSIKRIFSDEPFEIVTTTQISVALELLQKYPIKLVISDQRLSQDSGIEFLMKALEIRPNVIRILFTGYSDITVIEEAIHKAKIHRFILKPWNIYDLKLTVLQGIRYFDLEAENRTYSLSNKKNVEGQEPSDQQKSSQNIFENIPDEPKRIENKELKQFYETLESRVKERTNALEESWEYSRLILETANDAFISLDEEGLIIDWNKRSQEVFGWTKEEVLGKELAEIIIPQEFRDAHRHGMKRYLKTGKSENLGRMFEVKAMRRNGEEFPAELTMWAILLNKKNHFNAFLRDISQRKAAEKDVIQLASAIESVGDMIIITDDQGIVQYVNSAFEKITGYQRQEFVGRKPNVLKSGKQDAQFYRQLWDTILQGNVWRGVFVNKKKDGSFLDVEAIITPIREQGRIVSFVAVERDVTERQASERRLRSMLEALQKAHNEVREIQDQLLQSEKMASIGHLAAGIAHEINNPVGFISSNIQTFQKYMHKLQKYIDKVKAIQVSVKSGDTPLYQQGVAELEKLENEINISFIIQEINTMLKESVGGVERIVRIVNDLRNFSRTDDGSMNYANLHEAIDMSINIVGNEIKYKVELKKKYGELPPVKCSPQKLGQVIMNLLINAAQAMTERGIVEIKTYQKGEHAYIEVSDTGEGIPEENLKKIFDPFFTTKPVGKGTGLGLSVSYDIIKKHNGEISVASTVGKGTTFTIKLPI